jgi:hypothetical protein
VHFWVSLDLIFSFFTSVAPALVLVVSPAVKARLWHRDFWFRAFSSSSSHSRFCVSWFRSTLRVVLRSGLESARRSVLFPAPVFGSIWDFYSVSSLAERFPVQIDFYLRSSRLGLRPNFVQLRFPCLLDFIFMFLKSMWAVSFTGSVLVFFVRIFSVSAEWIGACSLPRFSCVHKDSHTRSIASSLSFATISRWLGSTWFHWFVLSGRRALRRRF